jgi:hypothetical protein
MGPKSLVRCSVREVLVRTAPSATVLFVGMVGGSMGVTDSMVPCEQSQEAVVNDVAG